MPTNQIVTPDRYAEPEPGFVEDEINDVLRLLDAFDVMAMGKWDHRMNADEFGVIMDVIRARVQRAARAATRIGGTA